MTVGLLHNRNLSTSSKHCHPELAVEGVAHDAKQLIAVVSCQAMNKQTEEDGSQDLTEQHSQAWLGLFTCRAQQATQRCNTWREGLISPHSYSSNHKQNTFWIFTSATVPGHWAGEVLGWTDSSMLKVLPCCFWDSSTLWYTVPVKLFTWLWEIWKKKKKKNHIKKKKLEIGNLVRSHTLSMWLTVTVHDSLMNELRLRRTNSGHSAISFPVWFK